MSAQPDLFREDEHARQRRLMRAWILDHGLAEEPSGCTPGIGSETYRQYFERLYGEALAR